MSIMAIPALFWRWSPAAICILVLVALFEVWRRCDAKKGHRTYQNGIAPVVVAPVLFLVSVIFVLLVALST